MKILEMHVYSGPDTYSWNPVIRIVLDIEDQEERPSNLIENFTGRLMEMIPTLYEHRCSEGVPGGFLTRLQEGTWAGHIVEHIALELQSVVGNAVGFGKARSADRKGVYNVVYSYLEEKVGVEAGHAAIRAFKGFSRRWARVGKPFSSTRYSISCTSMGFFLQSARSSKGSGCSRA